MSELTKVYVVPTGRTQFGDVMGVSCTKDRVWFSHCSSSLFYLERDTTDGFADRRAQLKIAYPDGYDVVLVDPTAELPEEIAHHFEAVPPVGGGAK